ncbi:NAD(P)-binding protein [Gonapodya prolifera JEL478]|uniref:NAD(P)-binding protein n=1 Tax=Gonapodya prolifera (strain JEL478) TaxID=1344416 RepID=A0A139AQD1_GONPJ|nr:NAD(P)-binding protein [Gonapodya prolifera JEL478]|eukprot:KXS18946.1 NAD(P)-binding protein [Gonapodya prolifera JEL478]
MATHTQILFVNRPKPGKLDPSFVFKSVSKPRPKASDLKDGEILVKNLYLSFDAAMRAWMGELKTYRDPLQIGQVMEGRSASIVLASKHSAHKPGDRIVGSFDWQQYTIVQPDNPKYGLESVPDGVSLKDVQYVAGMTALTAYFGLIDVGGASKGKVVVVSGAAGATGSMVGQIAKCLGCRVIGIAGGPDKCKMLVDQLGFDAAIDYKVDRREFTKRVNEVIGRRGYDVYFDNTGGMILEVLMNRMALRGRIVVCGSISAYEGTQDPRFALATGNLIPTRGRIEGFLVTDYIDRFPQALTHIVSWYKDGKIKPLQTTVPG